MESGNPVAYRSYKTNKFFQPLYNQLVKDAGCWDAVDNLDCLRHVPYAKLNRLLNTTDASAWQVRDPLPFHKLRADDTLYSL